MCLNLEIMKPFSRLLLIICTIYFISCSSSDQKRDSIPNSVEAVESPEPVGADVDVQIPKDVTTAAEDGWGGEDSQDWDEDGIDAVPVMATGSDEPQKGKLAVYCPRQMTYKQSSDIIGFIADVIDDELIENVMVGRITDMLDRDNFEFQENDLLIRELQYYSRIELRLDDADNEGFTIKKVHEDDL